MACKALTFDETLCNTLAHQGTVTPADFERVRGTSKHVAHARLYDFHEARYIWEKRTGGADTEAGPKMTDMFMPVQVDGRDKPMWRMR